MEDWEKTDVFQALNKVLQKEFCHLFQNEGLIFNAESMLDQASEQHLVMVYPLPMDHKSHPVNTNLLLGPFQLIFSLKNDESSLEPLIPDDKTSYYLNFRLNTFQGKVLKEDVSSLMFDPESREIQMSESIFQILKKIDAFMDESPDDGFHFCSGISNNKSLKLESIFVELFDAQNGVVMTRSRDCTYLVEYATLFSNDNQEDDERNASSLNPQKCQICSELDGKTSGLDLLKQLPPGIAIKPAGAGPTNASQSLEPNVKKPTGGVVIVKSGTNTVVPLISRPRPQPRPHPIPILPALTRTKRVIEDIPVMKMPSDDEFTSFQDNDAADVVDYSPRLKPKIEHPGTTFTCKTCKTRFRFQHSYLKHIKQCRGNLVGESSNAKDVVPVFKGQTKSENFACKYCQDLFTVELALFKHLEKCEKKPAKFTCHNCGRDFRHEINLQKHTARCMGEFYKRAKPIPGKKMLHKTGDNPAVPYNGEQVEKLEVEQCPICLRHLTKGQNFDKHIQLHIERLSEIQKPASCPKCDPSVTFPNRFELNSHFISTHGQTETKMPCGQCLEMVVKGLINQHIQRKHPHQPLLCPECGIAFKAPSLLNRHLRAQHNAGPHENWMCELCGNVYRERHGLRQHMQTSHFKKRDHVCFECGKGFISAQKLKQHNRIHTGAKPYGCSLCGYRCNRSYNVHAHLRKVHQISKPSIKTDVIIYEEDLKNEEKFNEVIQPIQEMDI